MVSVPRRPLEQHEIGRGREEERTATGIRHDENLLLLLFRVFWSFDGDL